MFLRQRAFRQTETIVEHIDEGVRNSCRSQGERLDSGFHLFVHRGGIIPVNLFWPGESVVLCHVDQLDGIKQSIHIDGVGTDSLVSDAEIVGK